MKIKTSSKFDKSLRELIDIMHFTEKVSTKIHGVSDKAEIYRIVNEEFARSKQYSSSIFLLTDDRSKLRLFQTSFAVEKSRIAEKLVNFRKEDFIIDLNKPGIYSQVVRDGKTVHAYALDLLAELFSQPLANQILETLGLENKCSLLTPLIQHEKIIGVFVMSSTDMTEHFIPSAKSLGQHISVALELADAHIEYRHAANELCISEARYRSLCDDALDKSEVGLFILDSDWRVVWMNQAMELYFGLDKNEIIGKNKRQLIVDRIKNIFEDPDNFAQRVIATYENNSYLESFECHVLPGEGRKERWLVHRSHPIRSGLYAGGRIEHYYDITEPKKLEKQLIQQEKLAAIGRFVAGVAHEINNPLDILLSKIEYIQMEGTNLNGMAEHLSEMKQQVLCISHITHSLLSHSKDLIVSFVALDINSVLENVLFMFRCSKLEKKALIETNFSQHLPQIL